MKGSTAIIELFGFHNLNFPQTQFNNNYTETQTTSEQEEDDSVCLLRHVKNLIK